MKTAPLSLFTLLLPFMMHGQLLTEVSRHVATHRDSMPYFGESVAQSDQYAVIGARFDVYDANGGNPLLGAGSVYVLEKDNNGNWQTDAKITPSDRHEYMYFGWDVATFGNYVVVGAPKAKTTVNGQLTVTGVVYIYKKVNGTWIFLQKLDASDKVANNGIGGFGLAVAIQDSLLVAGHPNNQGLVLEGKVYTFELNQNGQFSEIGKFSSPNASDYMRFGADVALHNGQLLVGSAGDNMDLNGQNMVSSAGSAEVFNYTGQGNWNFVQRFVPTVRNSLTQFGSAVDIWNDQMIVGARGESVLNGAPNNYNFTGAAYIYEKSNGSWSLSKKIMMPSIDSHDYLGWSVSIEQGKAAIGALFDEDGDVNSSALSFSGTVLYYKKDNGSWILNQTLLASDRDSGDYFGCALDLHNGELLVGAYGQKEDANGSNYRSKAGMVYHFTSGSSIGMEENHPDEDLLYPNPAMDVLHVRRSMKGFEVRISGLDGILYEGMRSEEDHLDLDLSHLVPGTYIVQLIDEVKSECYRILVID